jgi:tetratricopeptide (TPR) repeat protein
MQSGITSRDQEDLIFFFFIHVLRNRTEAEKYYTHVITSYPNVCYYKIYYAVFLQEIRKDRSKAEQYYKEAIELSPKDPVLLGMYAIFVQNSKEPASAEVVKKIVDLYSEAIELSPTNLLNLANYSGFLLSYFPDDREKKEEATRYMDRVLYSLNFISKEPDLASEAWFLALLHFPTEKKLECMQVRNRIIVGCVNINCRTLNWHSL